MRFTAELREWLGELSPETLTEVAIAGVTYDELPRLGHSLAAQVAAPDDFVLPPLPNHLFTRDTSAWISNGVTVNAMAKPARVREAVNVNRSIATTPRSRPAAPNFWSDDLGEAATLEGGDVLVVGKGCVLIGMGERTRPAAVEAMAGRLFEAGAARQVIAVVLPKQRSAMHLDTVMTMIDRDAFTIYPELRHSLSAYSLVPGRDALSITPVPDLFAALAEALDVAQAASDRNRRRPLRGRPRAVGRRQQRARRGARRGGRVRAKRRHQHPPAPRGHRGHHHRGRRARPRPRRSPLHVMPDPPRPCVTAKERQK